MIERRYDRSMLVTRLDNVATFARLAAPVLEHDPAANNLVLGIVQSLLDRPDSYAGASCWSWHDGASVGAIRTPPYNVVVADPLDEEAIDALVERLTSDEPNLPGVTANSPWSHASRKVGVPRRDRPPGQRSRKVSTRSPLSRRRPPPAATPALPRPVIGRCSTMDARVRA